ncbi:MAG: prepilin-type N-terminal cleavage/methylation domain-containing protein [Candidatus Methylomirabilales bacterium]
MFTPGRFSSPKGVTLIELLVALAFMAVFAAGMTGLAIGILNGNAKSQSSDTAVYLALDKLETIRNTAYANVLQASFPAEGYGTITVGGVSFPNFQRSVTIQNNFPATGMTRVVVTVGSRQGNSVSEEMVVGQ